MPIIDIIPDIHGQFDKLDAALRGLGWRRGPAGWTHPEPDRRIVFLGDFIDRGPQNAAVIRRVRDLTDSGKARAIMGNHEYNALHFHSQHPETGAPLRPHSAKNLHQHASFLAEFPLGAPQTRDVLGWMASLPLFIEEDGLRAVHACWRQDTIDRFRALSPDGVLSEAQRIAAADPQSALHPLTEEITKGPEQRLPDPLSFHDKDGTERREVRLKWWLSGTPSWRDVAISVPDPQDLPDTPLPPELLTQSYAAAERPVFFGHYWLSATPVLQGPNILCLDYSAGKDGPLVSYALEPGAGGLSADNIRVHAG